MLEDAIYCILAEKLVPNNLQNAVKSFNPKSDNAGEEQNALSQKPEDKPFMEKSNQEGQDLQLDFEKRQPLSQGLPVMQPDRGI